MSFAYEELLARLRQQMKSVGIKRSTTRIVLPEPQVIWVGNKTIFRNFTEYPKILRRDPDRLIMFLAKQLATAASIDGNRAIFIGRRDRQSFSVLIQRYMEEQVVCPICGSPDTHIQKVKRLAHIVCEACGAKSPVRTA